MNINLFKRLYATVLISILIIFSACAEETTSKSDPIIKGVITTTIEVDDIKRTYTLYIPESYTGQKEVPLVLCFHGYTGNAEGIMNYSKFNGIGYH